MKYFNYWITDQLILNYLDYINYVNNRKISFIRKKIFWGGTRIWTKDLSICSRLLYHWAIPPFMKMLPINIHNKESFKDCWACISSLIYSAWSSVTIMYKRYDILMIISQCICPPHWHYCYCSSRRNEYIYVISFSIK